MIIAAFLACVAAQATLTHTYTDKDPATGRPLGYIYVVTAPKPPARKVVSPEILAALKAREYRPVPPEWLQGPAEYVIQYTPESDTPKLSVPIWMSPYSRTLPGITFTTPYGPPRRRQR